MTWWQGRLCALDCETTGINLEESRIVTVTVAMVGAGLPAEIVTLMADPGVTIPEAASNVHGITTERAQAEGRPAAEVVAAALKLLRAVPESVPVVGFNLRFDLTILDREARRHGLEPFVPPVVIDGLVCDKHLDPYRKGSRRLDAVCKHYNARIDGAHDSAHDALAAARVAYRIGQTTELGHMTAEGLHDAQIGWAASQAGSLRDYFERQGKDVSDVREEWPVVPAP
jgi:DNA polymerase III subunit epsilon